MNVSWKNSIQSDHNFTPFLSMEKKSKITLKAVVLMLESVPVRYIMYVYSLRIFCKRRQESWDEPVENHQTRQLNNNFPV